MPIPPPESPIMQLKRHHTMPELKRELSNVNLCTTGTKSDLCLRLVKHKSGMITECEVASEFTVDELRRRLKTQGIPFQHSDTKAILVTKYMEHV